MEAAIKVLPISGQDRAIAIPAAGGHLVAVADGAGGSGGRAIAAEHLIAFVSEFASKAASTDWFEALCEFDDQLSVRPSSGQTTAIVAFVDVERVIGASVGDSSAWIIPLAGHAIDLTARQRRKPLLGYGEALPVQFESERFRKRVLIGSDGLFKYATADRICALATRGSVAEAACALAGCVQLPSGALNDDVAVAIVSE
jgi:serine/threonine protein phosphatase PrpC